MSGSTWIDHTGRKWSVAITVSTIKRVRQLIDVNLLEIADGQLLDKLASDAEFLADTLYAVCKPQADERGVSDVQFGELLAGDTITEATNALVRGITDFFPQQRRVVFERLWAKMNTLREATIGMASSKLESQQMDQAIQAQINLASAEMDRRIAEMLTPPGN